MLRYIIQRMLLMVPTLLGVAVLCFFMLRLMPGDPVQMMMDGANVSKAVIEAERAKAAKATKVKTFCPSPTSRLSRARMVSRQAAELAVPCLC